MLKLQLNFDRDELTKLMNSALRIWSDSSAFGKVTINGSVDGTVSGYFHVSKGVKTISVNLSHEVISAGIVEACARAGSPIDKDSLVFKYIEGSGYGGGASVCAVANQASAEQAQAQAKAASELVVDGAAPTGRATVRFPGQVTVHFSQDELRELISGAARRAGLTPSYVSVSYDAKAGTSASISVKTANNSTGTVSQSPSELIATLTEELTAQGYKVCSEDPAAFHFIYTSGGFGSRSGTSLRVSLSGLPAQ